ncbi:DUF779 domain-containing protein [Peijinzhouia sedimentorum]
MVKRVLVTKKAEKVIDELRGRFGELMFHQSGGCCDGSQPMCFEKGDFKVGGSDVWIGNVHGCDFFMNLDQFEYWKHTQLTLDITEGRGSSFSLEIPMGLRFVIKSTLFNEADLKNLEPVISGEDYLELGT